MPSYTADGIRNIALVGQSGGGKTTLVEAVLKEAGAIPAIGTVEKGTTVCDFDPLEKEYLHSLSSAVVSVDHDNIHVNLIDTPGMPDFIGQAISALPAVETVAVVIDAATGVGMVSRRMLEWAAERKLCRMIIINGIDSPGVDLEALTEQIREEFGPECLPINLPADGGARVVDCFFNPSGDADFSSVAAAHQALVDQVVEVDEELMARYLEQGEVAPEELHAPFERALREGHLVPVCFVSARNGAGVAELLEIMVRLLPNPTEGNPPLFYKGEGDAAVEFPGFPQRTGSTSSVVGALSRVGDTRFIQHASDSPAAWRRLHYLFAWANGSPERIEQATALAGDESYGLLLRFRPESPIIGAPIDGAKATL